MKTTKITVNNPMCGNFYIFECSKSTFMELWDNQLASVGYFTAETQDGITLVVNPSACSFIEIYEEESK